MFAIANPNYSYIAVAAYAVATGTKRWSTRWDPQGAGDTEGVDVSVTPDGKTIFVGGTEVPASGDHRSLVAAAYDTATGSQRWETVYRFPKSTSTQLTSFSSSHDGKSLVVVGDAKLSPNSITYLTSAFSSANGSRLWTVTTGSGCAARNPAFNALAVSSVGNMLFTTGGRDGAFFTSAYRG